MLLLDFGASPGRMRAKMRRFSTDDRQPVEKTHSKKLCAIFT